MIDESAKIELEHRVALYQFHLGSYIKGVAFFLAITGALLKFGLDSELYRAVFSWAGLMCNFAILIPLIFSFVHERHIARDFDRLAIATKTATISTNPLRMLAIATTVFWLILSAGWIYVIFWLV